MALTFRAFRKIVLGIILLASSASLGLSLYLRASFTHPNSTYVLVGILNILILASIISISRKTLSRSAQPVATEVLGLFTLLPFAMILTLYALTLSVIPDPTTLEIFAILQILIFIGTITHGLYTIGLIFTAIFTVCAFDRDVWSRDIDSSPSPFPMTILFRYIFPCLSRRDTAYSPTQVVPENRTLCLPGSCNCSKTQIPHTSEPGLDQGLEAMPIMRGISSTRSLVRVPNDVERRSSIVIAFEV
ncbi:hypothetical protein B0H15DRAFT_863110 [Mycena belliarum]|uniref:Uncharacterized protein n=1 Tax=Mycena belliarum TaxID=1033014 RepID=A0AAD6TTB9_9AGAR|nr:hypothetical protein B0H15DRAFT_863110 [Mycena belliae]